MDHEAASPLLNMPGKPAVSPLDPRFHLAAIVDSSDDPIISKDLEGTIISWNKAAARVFGYQEDEIVGQSILRLIPLEFHHEEDLILQRIRRGERIDHYEAVRMRKNGDRFLASVTISPIKDLDGNVIGISKIARDISERREDDESRYRLATIVDSADDAIISKDLNGVIRSWNPGACRMFGYTRDEMVGQSILRLIPNELRHEEEEILRKLRGGDRIEHYETTRVKKSGERIEVSVSISPIQNESGKVIGASKIARDISDRKRVERMLVQAEKIAATGRMAAAIAHEINNPLESLVNLVFLARQNCAEGGKADRYLLTAEGELERISHIARQTLGYYKDTGSPMEVHLNELIKNVLTVYNSRLVGAGISVNVRFNDLQRVVVSRGEMLQVFSNIIANAIDAMRHGGELLISTRKLISSAGDGVQCVIRDNGVGITSENLPKVFEPFFTTKGDVGTGIGLWVAKRLVEARGGQITIASSNERENSGTTITIFIPFATPGLRSDSERQ